MDDMTPLQQGLAWVVMLTCAVLTLRWCILDWPTCADDKCHLPAFCLRRDALGLSAVQAYCRFHAKQVDRARRTLSRTEI